MEIKKKILQGWKNKKKYLAAQKSCNPPIKNQMVHPLKDRNRREVEILGTTNCFKNTCCRITRVSASEGYINSFQSSVRSSLQKFSVGFPGSDSQITTKHRLDTTRLISLCLKQQLKIVKPHQLLCKTNTSTLR